MNVKLRFLSNLYLSFLRVNAGLTSGLDQFKTRVVVHNNGRVQWMGPINLRTSCKMDMRMYPYDVQVRQAVAFFY